MCYCQPLLHGLRATFYLTCSVMCIFEFLINRIHSYCMNFAASSLFDSYSQVVELYLSGCTELSVIHFHCCIVFCNLVLSYSVFLFHFATHLNGLDSFHKPLWTLSKTELDSLHVSRCTCSELLFGETQSCSHSSLLHNVWTIFLHGRTNGHCHQLHRSKKYHFSNSGQSILFATGNSSS